MASSLREALMRRTQLLCAIVVNLWSVVAAAGQATDAGALSGALRAHVQNERLEIVTSIRGLPLGVRDALQTLWGGSLDIAEPGAQFQSTGSANSRLPLRRLIAAGCSIDHCLVYYERGGPDHTWHVVLYNWTPDGTRFEWGAPAPAGMTNIDAVRTAVLSGTIKGPGKVW
jgi:hypothetical protein